MSRPNNKQALQRQSQEGFQALLDLIKQVPDKQQVFPVGMMNRSIRDVCMHLHQWHCMFLDWYAVGMQGEKPLMPAKGYAWKDTPQLNKLIWEACQEVELEDAINLLAQSYAAVQAIIAQHDQEELFVKKRYAWTGSTSLGAYLVSATCSHYEWAIKLIKKATKPVD